MRYKCPLDKTVVSQGKTRSASSSMSSSKMGHDIVGRKVVFHVG
jgi:hypothetical protein